MKKKKIMEVILIKDVDNLGGANEVVKVKNGYARNFLLPRKLAVESSPSNRAQLEERLKQVRKKEEKMLAEINSVIAKLKEAPLKLGAKPVPVAKSSVVLPLCKSVVLSASSAGMKSTVAKSALPTRSKNSEAIKRRLTLAQVTIQTLSLKW